MIRYVKEKKVIKSIYLWAKSEEKSKKTIQ